MKHIRIKAADKLGNVAYLYSTPEGKGPYCSLANGVSASFSYAGIPENQYMELRFAFEDAASANDFYEVVKKLGTYSYERIK